MNSCDYFKQKGWLFRLLSRIWSATSYKFMQILVTEKSQKIDKLSHLLTVVFWISVKLFFVESFRRNVRVFSRFEKWRFSARSSKIFRVIKNIPIIIPKLFINYRFSTPHHPEYSEFFRPYAAKKVCYDTRILREISRFLPDVFSDFEFLFIILVDFSKFSIVLLSMAD